MCVLCAQQDLMLRPGQTNNDLDPFLSCSSNSVDHSRQESADSGLGLGNNYSLPHTPEDFLSSNMDDNMDCTSGKDQRLFSCNRYIYKQVYTISRIIVAIIITTIS